MKDLIVFGNGTVLVQEDDASVEVGRIGEPGTVREQEVGGLAVCVLVKYLLLMQKSQLK
jgi:hypothetical protein